MINVDLDQGPTGPTASNTLDREGPSSVTVKPGLVLRALTCRTALRLREALTRVGVRAVSATLRLSWRLDITVTVDAEVVAADRDTARAALERFLRDTATRVVVYAPDRVPIGWRELGGAPVEQIHEIVAGSDDADDRPVIWSVSTVVTASATVAARDAHLVDSYSDIAPFTTPQPIRHLVAGNDRIRRLPVRHRRQR